MLTNTKFILIVKIPKVAIAKPQTIKNNARAAFISSLAAPSAALPVVEYEAAIPREGSWSSPKESQKTENSPVTIIGKNCAWIQRKMQASVRRTGPVKKKIPLVKIRIQL